jgi:hypothetical protein
MRVQWDTRVVAVDDGLFQRGYGSWDTIGGWLSVARAHVLMPGKDRDGCR